MSECPPTPDLERMLADELEPDRAKAVEAHVAGCDRCQAELERLTDTPSSIGMDLSVTRTGRPDSPTLLSRGPSPMPEVPGYLLERELGRGGMGVVYQARQLRLNRTVALKMILAGEFASAEVTRRFLAEAEIIARIAHPNIVQVFDFGDVNGRAYFAMEYIEGGNLADRLTGKPWLAHEAARLIETVAHGLSSAHAVGVVHRDLKPANILLSGVRGQASGDRSQASGVSKDKSLTPDPCLLTPDACPLTPKIADFGVAKLTEGGHGLTLSQALIGSPNYMSPEQAEGKSATVGPAADVWALGAVLYELLTGRKAFDGPTPLGVLERVKAAEPTPPSRMVRGVPRDLDTIVRTCLEKDPARRYASAALLAEDLRRFREGETILARPVGGGQRLVRWARRHPVESGLVAALFLALGLGLLGTAWKWQEAVRERNTAEVNETRAKSEKAAATEAKRVADEARDAWQRITSEAAFARGDDLARRGDVAAGLFWMHEALRTAPPDDPHWADVIRRNLGGWDARLHTLKHIRILEGMAYAAAVSPDGTLVLVGSSSGEAALIETATGTVLVPFAPIPRGVECVAFSPDGKRAVIGGPNGVWRVDVAARRMLDEEPWIKKKAFRFAFMPDNRRLLTCEITRKATLWDLDTGKALREFDTGNDELAVRSVAVRLDGEFVALGLERNRTLGAASEVQVWPVDGKADQPTAKLLHPSSVLSVRFHPTVEPLLVTACADSKVRLWDTVGKQLRGDPMSHPKRTVVESAVFTPNGRAIVTACTDGLVRWWQTEDGRPLGSSLRHDGGVYGAAFDDSGKWIATHSADRTVRLYSVAPKALPGPPRLVTAIRAALADDGSRAVAAGETLLRFRDTTTGDQIGSPMKVLQGLTTPITVGPGGRRFAAVDRLKVLRVWEGDRNLIETKLDRGSHGLTFDPTGDRLAVVQNDGIVELWDVPARKAVHTLGHDGGIVWNVAFDSTGRWLGAAGPMARLWDLGGQKPFATDLPDAVKPGAIRFRPDGWAILTQFHRTARLWDAATPTPLGPIIGPFEQTFDMAFTPDGRGMASWCASRVRLWDATTGEPWERQTYDHAARVEGVAFDPTGGMMLVALEDQTAQFWDLRTRRPLGPSLPMEAKALAVGRVAATGLFVVVGDDGKVHPLSVAAPASGTVEDLEASLRRRTSYAMKAGTVSPLFPEDWQAESAGR